MAKRCPVCQSVNTDEVRFCKGCGTPMRTVAPMPEAPAADTVACTACGHANKPAAKFCAGCGAAMGASAPEPIVAAASAPTTVAPTTATAVPTSEVVQDELPAAVASAAVAVQSPPAGLNVTQTSTGADRTGTNVGSVPPTSPTPETRANQRPAREPLNIQPRRSNNTLSVVLIVFAAISLAALGTVWWVKRSENTATETVVAPPAQSSPAASIVQTAPTESTAPASSTVAPQPAPVPEVAPPAVVEITKPVDPAAPEVVTPSLSPQASSPAPAATPDAVSAQRAAAARAARDKAQRAARAKAEQDRRREAQLRAQQDAARRAAAERQQRADDARRAEAVALPPPVVAAPVARTVKQICANKSNFISRDICESRECKKPGHQNEPTCISIKNLESRNTESTD